MFWFKLVEIHIKKGLLNNLINRRNTFDHNIKNVLAPFGAELLQSLLVPSLLNTGFFQGRSKISFRDFSGVEFNRENTHQVFRDNITQFRRPRFDHL